MINLLPEEMRKKEKKPKEKEEIPIRIRIPEEEIREESIAKEEKPIFKKEETVKKEEIKEEKEEIKKEKKSKEVMPEKPYQSPGLEISLMPTEGITLPWRVIKSKLLLLLFYFLIFILIVFLIHLYANWRYRIFKTNIRNYQEKIASFDKEIKTYLPLRDQIISLEKKVQRTDSILNNHIYWTKFFTLLEHYTVPNVYYRDFSADDSGKIILPATAKTLSDVACQWLAFSNAKDFVKSANISDILFNKKGEVEFKIKLELLPDILHK